MNVKTPLAHLYSLLLILLALSSGCTALAISAAGAGAGIGIPYVLSDCADRTLNFSYEEVEEATPIVLEKLDMDPLAAAEIENGKRIKASANNLDITIEMEKVTLRATRVTINAKKGAFVKDRATAEEILNQLEKALMADQPPAPGKGIGKAKSSSIQKSNASTHLKRPDGPSFVGF